MWRVAILVGVVSCDAREQAMPHLAPLPTPHPAPLSTPHDDPPPPLDEDVPPHEPAGPPPSFRSWASRPGTPLLELRGDGYGFLGRAVRASLDDLGILTVEGGQRRCHGQRIISRERIDEAIARLAALFERDPNSPSCEGDPIESELGHLTVRIKNRTFAIVNGDRCPPWIKSAFQIAQDLVTPWVCP